MSGNSSALSSISYITGIEQQIMLATGLGKFASDILLAVILLLASVVLAKAVKYFITVVAPHLVSRTQTSLDDELLNAVNGPLQIFIVVMGLYIAILTIESLSGSFNFWINRLLLVAVIFIAAYLLANIVNALLNWYRNDIAPKTESDLDDSFIPFLQKVAWAVIVVLSLLVSLEQLQIIEITPLITGLGIVGIAVALAAKELLSNFFGSVAILSDRPYKVGDRVSIQGTDSGDVVEIGLRSTRLKTLDNRYIIVPNTKIASSRILNYSMPNTEVIFDIKVDVSYNSDVNKAARIMREIALATDGVLAEPGPTVHVTALGDYSVKLLMLVPVKSYTLSWVIPDKIYRQILKQFEAEGIEIPYPIQNVLIKGARQPDTGMQQQPISPFQMIR
ncbi:mechanosensitive ion channel family protein [Methanocella sp. MCL-LM]|uniref:mechanosensitive ion channel family protein n=1 Tax=Methanocella sp. MCL-LM TaxID=3412035 RepID=UPI003C73782E